MEHNQGPIYFSKACLFAQVPMTAKVLMELTQVSGGVPIPY